MAKILFYAIILSLLISQAGAQPYILDSTSTVAGEYSWGANWWTPFQWYRYAQCNLNRNFTRGLARPTYLNAVLGCSQGGSTSTFDVYISTSDMLNIPQDSWVYLDGTWRTWHTRTGGYFVGRYISPPGGSTPGLVSWNIDTWIQSHPATGYCVVFDQQGDNWDALAYQVWLGRQARISFDISEDEHNNPTSRNRASTSHPNPFNKSTSIKYYLQKKDKVSTKIFDIRGECIRSFTNAILQEPGTHVLSWDRIDNKGKMVSNGTYFYRIEMSDQILQGKMIVRE